MDKQIIIIKIGKTRNSEGYNTNSQNFAKPGSPTMPPARKAFKTSHKIISAKKKQSAKQDR